MGIPFDHPAIRWTISAQLIVRLDRFTITDITDITDIAAEE
ncbi:hypothetical protein ACWF94_02735 [Streptomyces sp. NPDC055078]